MDHRCLRTRTLWTVVRLLLLTVLMLNLFAPAALAWSNGDDWGKGFGTHDWMLYEARRMAGSPKWLDVSRAMSYTDDPDMVSRDFWYHVYDVWGANTYGNSPSKVESYYNQAVKAYKAKRYRDASKYVGLLSHYYVDSVDPLHTDSSDAEDGMHSNWERAVDTRLDSKGEHRSWLKYDGYQSFKSAKTKTKSGAKYAHQYYGSLVNAYNRSGYDSTVSTITKKSVNKATNGLADIIRQIPKGRLSGTTSGSTGTTYVYITDTGEKYHRDGCRYLAKSKHKVTLSYAKQQGYSPCSVCDPPR